MKNIKTKKGEIETNQLTIGIVLLFLGILFFYISFMQLLTISFIVIGIIMILTSYKDVYYCKNCGNNHGEYPYNSCKKCGNIKFTRDKFNLK